MGKVINFVNAMSQRHMLCTPHPLTPSPLIAGTGEKFVVGFAHSEQGSALHPIR